MVNRIDLRSILPLSFNILVIFRVMWLLFFCVYFYWWLLVNWVLNIEYYLSNDLTNNVREPTTADNCYCMYLDHIFCYSHLMGCLNWCSLRGIHFEIVPRIPFRSNGVEENNEIPTVKLIFLVECLQYRENCWKSIENSIY